MSPDPGPEDRPSLGERLAFARVPLWAVALLGIAGFGVLLWFGGLVQHAGQRGRAGRIATALVETPRTLRQLRKHPVRFRPMYGGDYERLPNGLWRNPDQPFVDPGFVLLTAFDDDHNRAEVHLVRLSDGKVLHRWIPDTQAINDGSHFTSAMIDLKRDKTPARNLMMHPLLTADGGLVIHDTTPLVQIDACGKVEWLADGIYHHALERDADGRLWAAYRAPRSSMPDTTAQFKDEALVQLTPQGKVLRQIRVADLLDDNGLGDQWRTRPYVDDPFHLNDIQPVLADGPYWKRGDVFVSLRNLSMLLLYRPSTGKVLWWKSGPWAMQHDVEILDDHRISVFDNHWRFAAPEGEVDGTNRVLTYDFATGQVDDPLAAVFQRYHIDTRAQGRATPLANGDTMIEETEPGRLMRVAPDGTLRWRYISADATEHRFQLRWSRYLDPTDDTLKAISAAEHAQCH